MTTATAEPRKTPAYTVRKNAEGLTEREQEFRRLYNDNLSGVEIAERMGVNKQRVSEWKVKLEKAGLLDLPKPLEQFTKSEWRALSAGLRARAAASPDREACGRAIEKARQLLPQGVAW